MKSNYFGTSRIPFFCATIRPAARQSWDATFNNFLRFFDNWCCAGRHGEYPVYKNWYKARGRVMIKF